MYVGEKNRVYLMIGGFRKDFNPWRMWLALRTPSQEASSIPEHWFYLTKLMIWPQTEQKPSKNQEKPSLDTKRPRKPSK